MSFSHLPICNLPSNQTKQSYVVIVDVAYRILTTNCFHIVCDCPEIRHRRFHCFHFIAFIAFISLVSLHGALLIYISFFDCFCRVTTLSRIRLARISAVCIWRAFKRQKIRKLFTISCPRLTWTHSRVKSRKKGLRILVVSLVQGIQPVYSLPSSNATIIDFTIWKHHTARVSQILSANHPMISQDQKQFTVFWCSCKCCVTYLLTPYNHFLLSLADDISQSITLVISTPA